MSTYIHYGHNSFDVNKFIAPQNRRFFNKPIGGLWASKTDTKYGWKQWCEQEDFCKCSEDNSFLFTIFDSANILYINCVDDVKKLPDQKIDISLTTIKTVDFEQLIANGIDAIDFNFKS